MERKAADAIAEVVVTHFDENASTKSDIARLEGKIEAENAKLNGKIDLVAAEGKERDRVMMVMLTGVSIGIVVLIVAQFFHRKIRVEPNYE